MPFFKRLLTVFCALALLGFTAGGSGAQQAAAAPPQTPSGAAIPEPHKLDLLVRTTIIAINQANITGNYTVFRDLAAPVFQSQNSPARLSDIFASLRKRNLDLSPVVFFQPKFARPPVIENSLLRLSGFFATRPEQVNFDLAYQNVNGRWLLAGVSLNTTPSSQPAAAAAGVKPDATATTEPHAGGQAAHPKPPAAKRPPARGGPAPRPGPQGAATQTQDGQSLDSAVESRAATGARSERPAGNGGESKSPAGRSPAGPAETGGAAGGAAASPEREKSPWPF